MRRMRTLMSLFLALTMVMMALTGSGWAAGAIKDDESASHADEAALVSPIETYKFDGFEVVQFDLPVLSQYSFMIVSRGQALVVDPARDVFSYLDYAAKNDLKIIGVFLTHNNADYVAGHIELATMLGVPVYISHLAGTGFDHKPLKDGSVIEIGAARMKALATPGHTPESMTGLLVSASAPDKPLAVLTGDALFVGSVGRPDLMGGTMAAATLASMMYDTWHNRFAPLPDETIVLPAHGARSLCGAHLSDDPSSTIGRERKTNPYVQHKSRGDFIAAILDGLPDAPQYFKHNAAMNKRGPARVDWRAAPEMITAPDASLSDIGKYYVVDLRDAAAFAAGHVPNSVNIGLRGRVETWLGITVPWRSNLVLVGSPAEIKEALYRLHRVGYTGRAVTMETWTGAGQAVTRNEMIKPRELYQAMERGDNPVVVDVRLPKEWMGLRIDTVLNLPLNRLAALSVKLDPAQPVVTVCNSAYRSSMAVGILERNGFTKASSLDGGAQAWMAAGLPVYGSTAKEQTAVRPQRIIDLPERLDPAALKRMLVDLPGTFDIVDIRPAAAFADYHLPGSYNAPPSDLIDNPAWLTGAGPLIIVDRDGSLAMALGGILSQKTKRRIKVLYGGLSAYWEDREMGSPGKAKPMSGAPAVQGAPRSTAPAPGPAPAAPAKPKKPKRKSAGC